MEPFCGKYLFQQESFSDSEMNFWKEKKKREKEKLSILFLKVGGCLVLRHSLEEMGNRGSNPTYSVC